jgi:hypothetical protein
MIAKLYFSVLSWLKMKEKGYEIGLCLHYELLVSNNLLLSDAFCTDFASGTIRSRKSCSGAPYVYLSKIGRSQVFEHVSRSSSKAIGIKERTLSGPIAITAAPMHSATCRWHKFNENYNLRSTQI